MKARFSALPVLQFCGQAQRVASLGAGSRVSAIGTAFHARAAKSPDAEKLAARLSEDERAELDALIMPMPTKAPEPAHARPFEPLDYEHAEKELAVGLSATGFYAPKGDPSALVEGTLDMAWHVLFELGSVAYVCDIKKTAHAARAAGGPRSPQVVGYALAYASLKLATHYCVGIYDATEGTYEWGEVVDRFSAQCGEDLDLVLAAADNIGGEYNVGSHCRSCYGRTQCPQYLLPLELAETTLAPFTMPGALSREGAALALVQAQRAADTAEKVIAILKAFARDVGPLPDGSGKLWGPVGCKGKMSLDRAALEAAHPDIVQRYMQRGAPYDQFRWTNDPAAPKPKRKAKPKAKPERFEPPDQPDNGDHPGGAFWEAASDYHGNAGDR